MWLFSLLKIFDEFGGGAGTDERTGCITSEAAATDEKTGCVTSGVAGTDEKN